jgi:hypothetical protein
MHAFQQLAFSSATLQIHFELNTNATALLGSLLWAVHTLAAAFLRRSSITGLPQNSSDFTHCAYFQQNPTFGDNLSERKPFWTVRLHKNSATNEAGTSFAPQNHDLERVDFTMDETDFFALCFPLLFLCDVFERGKFFGGYTMEMAYKEENAER